LSGTRIYKGNRKKKTEETACAGKTARRAERGALKGKPIEKEQKTGISHQPRKINKIGREEKSLEREKNPCDCRRNAESQYRLSELQRGSFRRHILTDKIVNDNLVKKFLLEVARGAGKKKEKTHNLGWTAAFSWVRDGARSGCVQSVAQ